MRIFNISRQFPAQQQAWIKEYVNRMVVEVDSLHQYINYFNPEWRLVTEDADNRVVTPPSYTGRLNGVNSINLFTDDNDRVVLNLDQIGFRWGVKNTSNTPYFYGPVGAERTLNIGSILFKIDAVDISTPIVEEDLSHFIVFEPALGASYTCVVSVSGDEMIYTWEKVNENDYGLIFPLQMPLAIPRYFTDDDLLISYLNDPLIGGIIKDVHNYLGNFNYELWNGATSLNFITYLNSNIDLNNILLDEIYSSSRTSDGVTATVDREGVITLSGTASQDTRLVFGFRSGYQDASTYILIVNNPFTVAEGFYVCVGQEDTTEFTQSYCTCTQLKQSNTFYIPAGEDVACFIIGVSAGVNVSGLKFAPSLVFNNEPWLSSGEEIIADSVIIQRVSGQSKSKVFLPENRDSGVGAVESYINVVYY